MPTSLDLAAFSSETPSLSKSFEKVSACEVCSPKLQHELARHGHHRVPTSDLVMSAAAQGVGLTVLHYDSDFERIADAGGAAQEWVVPRGSL